LSKPSKTNGLEMSSDFLHDIPDDIDHEVNLSKTILACVEVKSSSERLAIYNKLLDILSKII
ncbi:unnamed protein product, partial [Adineta steineri]